MPPKKADTVDVERKSVVASTTAVQSAGSVMPAVSAAPRPVPVPEYE